MVGKKKKKKREGGRKGRKDGGGEGGGGGRKGGCCGRAVFSPEANYRCILHSFTLTGIVKTHQLGYQECEALQAVFTKDLSPNHIAGPARYKGHIAMWNLSLGLLLLHLNW